MPQARDGVTFAPPLAEGGFQRVYRVKERTRHGINFLLVALAGGFLFFNIAMFTRGRFRPTSLRELLSLLFLELAMPSLIVWLGSSYNKRVILHQESIEVVGWFYSRKLYFAEIRGRQTTRNSGPYGYPAHVFLPSDSQTRKLILPAFLCTDEYFRAWIKTIPKLPRKRH
jgi:hypothetical protein